MRFATVIVEKTIRTVIERGGRLVDLHALAQSHSPKDERPFPYGRQFVAEWEKGARPLRDVVAKALSLPLDQLPLLEEVRFLPPIPDPQKVIAVGLNYESHCREQHREPPKLPMLFAKIPSCLVGHREPVVYWPVTNELDYEGELAVVIGRGGRNIPEERALEHCFGFTIMNDITARDLQRSEKHWIRAKGLDTFGPLGPFVVTTEEIPEPQALKIRTYVNESLVQDASTAEMLFPVRKLVAFISEAITLQPGDIVATGTPAGVGVFASPPRFLKVGDVVRVHIEKIGELVNPVVCPGATAVVA